MNNEAAKSAISIDWQPANEVAVSFDVRERSKRNVHGIGD
jgi:hypothetical protein